MRNPIIAAVAVVSLFAGCVLAEPPATQPAASQPSDELLADKSSLHGYETETARLVNEKDEIVTTLRNGLTVIVKRVPSPVTCVRCHIRTGSVYEGQWLGGGLSHLLEHLVAGGSNARRTEAENRNLLQKIGNNSNAYTTFDATSFFIDTTTDHMEDAVDLVSGWVFGASITPDEYRREYQVVQRELEMGKGDPATVFDELTYANRYRVSPARVPVIGYQEVIQGLTRDDVYGYYKLAYQPQNMVFGIVGNHDPEEMLKAIQKYVGDVKPGREFTHHIPQEPAVVAPRTMVATFPKLGHAELELGFPSVKLDSPDLYALDLLASILGDGYGAMMTETLRDEKQLAQDVSVVDDTPDYVAGTFEISLTLPPDKIKEATDTALAMLDEIKENGVKDDRIKRAKIQLKVNRYRDLQTSDDISTAMVEDFISTGDPHFRDHYTAKIQQITDDQLRDVARRYFDRSKLITTALMPADDPKVGSLPAAEALLRPDAQVPVEPGDQSPLPQTTAVRRDVLPNGTVLLTKRMAGSPLVSIQMLALGGQSIETEDNNGIGNLAMAMIQRGTGPDDATDVADVFDSIGGQISTGCGRNDWSWTASCLGTDFKKAFTTWADMINHPTFDDKEFAPMKQRIASDIASQDANWEEQSLRYFKSDFFSSLKSPYRFSGNGTQENLDRFTNDQAKAFYSGSILKAPRVLAVYGDIDPDQVKALATALLGKGEKLPAVAAKADNNTPAEPTDLTPQSNVLRVDVQKTDQALAGVVIGYQSSSLLGDSDVPSLTVANAMASGYGYPTGYLFETLRGLGLVYTTYAEDLPGRSASLPGGFIAVAGCDPANVNQVADLILQNIARLQGTPADLQEDWFTRSKQMIVVGDAMDSETAESQAGDATFNELMGLGYADHAHFADRINAVKIGDIGKVARERLRQCVVTISTPRPDLVKVAAGLRKYDSFPAVNLTPRGVKHDTKAPAQAPATPAGTPTP